ncbi:MAG: META domain-containing protein [Sandarakinorhabdus sp.]|nr:META domain-containing protein [Sandarakinorhabdus sp.]
MKRCAVLALLAMAGCASADPYVKEGKRLVQGIEPVIAGTLAGGPWLVEDINGGGVIDDARVDLAFAEGRVSGRSGCNRFSGDWQQAAQAIKLGPLMGTRMACAPAIMVMEAKFLAALEATTTVVFDNSGAALLKAPDGRVVKIRREAK